MSNHIHSVYDDLARVTAEIDQVQAYIEWCRSEFPNDQIYQLQMDQMQTQLDKKRERVKLMRYAADIIHGKIQKPES